MQRLFTLRYTLLDGSKLTIDAYHTGEFDARGTAKVTIRATHASNGDRTTVWEPGQTWCHPSPWWTLDSPQMRALVTELVAIKPDDTDEDYFASHSPEQIDFAQTYGDDLKCLSLSRYGEI